MKMKTLVRLSGWHARVGIWGTDLTPPELQSQDVSIRASLKIAANFNLKLLRDSLHARKNTEIANRLSSYITQREDKIAEANVHIRLQSNNTTIDLQSSALKLP